MKFSPFSPNPLSKLPTYPFSQNPALYENFSASSSSSSSSPSLNELSPPPPREEREKEEAEIARKRRQTKKALPLSSFLLRLRRREEKEEEDGSLRRSLLLLLLSCLYSRLCQEGFNLVCFHCILYIDPLALDWILRNRHFRFPVSEFALRFIEAAKKGDPPPRPPISRK